MNIAGVPTEFRRLGDPDLARERIQYTEAGVEYFVSPAYSIKADGFYSSISDYILGDDFTLRVGGPAGPPRPDCHRPRTGSADRAGCRIAPRRFTPAAEKSSSGPSRGHESPAS